MGLCTNIFLNSRLGKGKMNPKILDLITAYRMSKDEGAIISLQAKFQPLVYSLMRRFFVPKERWEDVSQDAFVQLLECAASYDPSHEVSFEAYYKIQLQYFFFNQIRKKSELLIVDRDWLLGTSMADQVESPLGNAQALAITGETSQEISGALARLTDRQRQAVILFYFDNMTLTQVAKEMGCSYNVASKHKDRGVRNLRQILAGTVLL